jgi:ABC-type transport system substrate-binding protein
MYGLGWAPDYPDPTDYVVPLYASNATYTAGDAVAPGLEQPAFALGCAQGPKNFTYWASLAANPLVGIPQSCQGVAYRALQNALAAAAGETDLAKRVILYDEAEQIAYALCLYTYTGQANAVPNMSSWVDISSVNTNVMTGGDFIFYTLTGNGVQYAGST